MFLRNMLNYEPIAYVIPILLILLFWHFFARSMPTHSKTSYIPRALLFGTEEVLGAKVSPDELHMAFVKKEVDGAMNLYTASVESIRSGKTEMRQRTFLKTPEIYRFFWSGDSQHIVFLFDREGKKAHHVYSLNIASSKLTNHTEKFLKIGAKIYKIKGSKVAIGINERDPNYHDVYILDLSDGSLVKVFENKGYARLTLDDAFKVVLSEKRHIDGSVDIYKGRTLFLRFNPEDAFHSRIVQLIGSKLYYLDTRKSNTTQLKSVDLKTGTTRVIAHDARCDISDIVFAEGKAVAYATTWLKKKWHSLSAINFVEIENKLGGSFEIVNQSPHFWIIRSSNPQKIGESFYLYEHQKQNLYDLYVAPSDSRLVDMIPFTFKARDGLELTAYLSLPKQYNSIQSVTKPIPLIAMPHGGPFRARDNYEFNPFVQWLASRGYAVLTVNFRLSSGFGKKLVTAGNGEWGRKALYDVIDAAQWCIDQKITTKEQLGIMGSSYGGYTTLAALAFTPDEFQVGVDIVGPSSLVTMMETIPNYWDWPPYTLADDELFFTRGEFAQSTGGDPNHPSGRKFLKSRSPLYFAKSITKPLLIIHGDNDPIVKKAEAVQLFKVLQDLKKKVCMISFSNEGHRFEHYANVDVALAYSEKWLHDALGGDFEPIDAKHLKHSTAVIEGQ